MSTEGKRLSYDYRTEYFKKNPGLFGCVWFCSQCGMPLFGRGSVQVDHVVPLKKFYGVNRTFNTVAICARCNKKKSAKVGLVTFKGMFAKIIEVIMFNLQKLVLLFILLLMKVGFMILQVLTLPIKAAKNPIAKLAFIAGYMLVGYWILLQIGVIELFN